MCVGFWFVLRNIDVLRCRQIADEGDLESIFVVYERIFKS